MNKLPFSQSNSKKQKGSVAVEYMILSVFLGLTMAAGATYFGQALNNQFGHSAKMVATLNPNGGLQR